jgi:hypothetical protein
MLTLSMSSSSSIKSSYFLSFYLISKCSGFVGQLSIFHKSFFSSSLRVIRLYLHFSCVNYVRQTEQSKGFSVHYGLRQTIFTSSYLCFSFMHVILDLRLSFGCTLLGFIYKFQIIVIINEEISFRSFGSFSTIERLQF